MTEPVLAAGAWPAAHLYDSLGDVFVADLPTASRIAWQDVLSQAGVGSFRIPVEDAGDVVPGAVVKFSQYGAIRFGVRLVSESWEMADGRRWLVFDGQPGLFGAFLGQATIFPEYGLTRTSGSTRRFGFMSIYGPWKVDEDWSTPVAVPFHESVHHARYPTELAATDPSWIAASPGPEVVVPGFTTHYARRSYFTADTFRFEFLITADDEFALYWDGEELASERDPSQRFGWRRVMSISTGKIPPGLHTCAVVFADDAPGSLIGLIMTIWEIDARTGDRIQVFHMTDDSWEVIDGTDNPPGWYRAQVLLKCVQEAADRGIPEMVAMQLGFDNSVDSDGEAWEDRGEYAFDIGNVTLSEVATQLAESEMDVAIDPATSPPTLNAWKRRGSDLSGTVALTLGSGSTGNAKAYSTTKSTTRRTAAIVQMSNGRWLEIQAPDIGTLGRSELGLELGSVSNAATATEVGKARLAELADPPLVISGESAAGRPGFDGAVPYLDYDIGDTIPVPGHRGVGVIKARVVEIIVDATGDGGLPDAHPVLVEDRSV